MPKHLRQQPGSVSQYFEEQHQQGRVREFWCAKCRHCQHLVEFFTLAEKRDANVCHGCMGLICNKCQFLRSMGKPCMVEEEQIRIEERIAARVATSSELQRYFDATGR